MKGLPKGLVTNCTAKIGPGFQQFPQVKEKKPSKYRAIKTTVGSFLFDSKREAMAWASLTQAQRAGLISNLERQVDIPLVGEKGPILTPTGRQMHYRADFVFVEKGLRIIADAKGYATEKFTLKKAILAAMGYSIRII